MNATAINQKVSTGFPFLGREALGRFQGLLFVVGAVAYLAHHDEHVEEAHDEVQPHEPDEREEHAARRDQRRDALLRTEEPVGEPRLSSELRAEPPGGVGYKRE